MENEKWYVRQGDDFVIILTEASECLVAKYETDSSSHNLTVSNASIIASTHNQMLNQNN